jgi:uncharacterized protein
MARVAALDHLRGLSILGILMVNAIGFAQPVEVYDHPNLIPLTAADETVWTIIEVFFHDKFITAFTLLFGVSTFLVGADPRALSEKWLPLFGLKSATTGSKVLQRRLLWLVLFGLIHGALIWCGDILLLYAVCGLIFSRWRHMQWRRLLSLGLLVFVIGAVTVEWPQSGGTTLDPAEIARMRSGFAGSLMANFGEWGAHFLPAILAYLPITLGGMMLGLGLFRSGFLKGEAPVRVYWVSIAVAVICLGVVFAAVNAAGPWAAMVNGLLSLPVVLGYASALILVGRSGVGRIVLHPLACAGRMAFTNYLCQSLIMTAIFYGGRGPGLFGTMGFAALVPIVVTIWVGQLLFSTLWLQWFRYGPFEWGWRSLSYGRPLALRK